MKEKYYTPELEEFHVGFEFEAEVDSSMYRVEKGTWNKIVMNQMMMEDLLLKDKLWNNVRVKYLDREDIESLGFEFDQDGCYHDKWCEKSLFHSDGENQVMITKNRNVLFKGTIKNKSELKKLLKQLGI